VAGHARAEALETLSGKIGALQERLKLEAGKVDHLKGLLAIYETVNRRPEPGEKRERPEVDRRAIPGEPFVACWTAA
jgi:hypothetical protein